MNTNNEIMESPELTVDEWQTIRFALQRYAETEDEARRQQSYRILDKIGEQRFGATVP